eukprot:m.958332 g.958332  ORF g.958332 m.958332 type:complete len:84 (-) comp23879_c0_seq23:214-465(-)
MSDTCWMPHAACNCYSFSTLLVCRFVRCSKLPSSDVPHLYFREPPNRQGADPPATAQSYNGGYGGGGGYTSTSYHAGSGYGMG